jgi:hypothetical protein
MVGGPTTGAAPVVSVGPDGAGGPVSLVAHDVLAAIPSAKTKNALLFIDSPCG